jgi:ribose 1,5-bisphosphokinase
MTQRLIYVVGPSGAGKDSVLQALRERWRGAPAAHWARRTITRGAQAGGENHEGVSEAAFDSLRRSGGLAMSWQANGLHYGIRGSELAPLGDGHCVFVNGSRAHVGAVLRLWPEATLVHITAPADLLMQRLKARRRESQQAISDRLARDVEEELPADAIRIVNDGLLESAVDMLQAALHARLRTDTLCVR